MGSIQSSIKYYLNQLAIFSNFGKFLSLVMLNEILVKISRIILHKIITFGCRILSSKSFGIFNEARHNFTNDMEPIFIIFFGPLIEEIMYSLPYTLIYPKEEERDKNYTLIFGYFMSAICALVFGRYELILVNLVLMVIKIKCKQQIWKWASIGLYSLSFGIGHSPTNQINHLLQSILMFSIPKVIYFLGSDYIAKINPLYGIIFGFVQHTFHNYLSFSRI